MARNEEEGENGAVGVCMGWSDKDSIAEWNDGANVELAARLRVRRLFDEEVCERMRKERVLFLLDETVVREEVSNPVELASSIGE